MASHLTDMEELISSIIRPLAADYMVEAMKCYNAGAYRACVVLCYIAVFDDLKEKLRPLATVNRDAKKIFADVEARSAAQEVFESTLSDQLASVGLVDATQKSRLDAIIKLRNKAAHPSGVHASAEEARYVFFEVCDKFLRQQQLQTTYAVDAIMIEIGKGNFFPSSSINDVKEIVSSELQLISKQAYPYLVKKLLEAFEAGPTAGPAASFIAGLVAVRDTDLKPILTKKVVVASSTSAKLATLIAVALNLDPSLFDPLNKIDLVRVTKLLSDAVSDGISHAPKTRLAHPLGWLTSCVKEKGQGWTLEKFGPAVKAVLESYRADPDLLATISAQGPIREAYIDSTIKRLASTSFSVANAAAITFPALEDAFGDTVDDQTAFTLISAIAAGAEHNAFDAINVVNANFSAAPKLRGRALKFANSDGSRAVAIHKANGSTSSLSDLMARLE